MTTRAIRWNRQLIQNQNVREKEKFYSMTVIIQKTTACLNDGTRRKKRKRMQKRARPDIRHAILTVRQNGQSTRRMQKWARLNIRPPKSQTAVRLLQLTVLVAIKSDNRQVHPGALQQRAEDATGRRVQIRKTSRTRRQTRQTQVWIAHRKRKRLSLQNT